MRGKSETFLSAGLVFCAFVLLGNAAGASGDSPAPSPELKNKTAVRALFGGEAAPAVPSPSLEAAPAEAAGEEELTEEDVIEAESGEQKELSEEEVKRLIDSEGGAAASGGYTEKFFFAGGGFDSLTICRGTCYSGPAVSGGQVPEALRRIYGGPMDPRLAVLLSSIQRQLGGRSISLTSGYRSPRHNKMVGGADDSMHTHGKAADIRIAGYNYAQVGAAARSAGAGGVGFYPCKRFTHVDTGPARSWTEGACGGKKGGRKGVKKAGGGRRGGRR
ncbi:MAG: DUF882 domain-containing protein [Elusimicrobiales bacterium]|nr:DUF882 domain-containing protein [Elusimicrobiales bacterium]